MVGHVVISSGRELVGGSGGIGERSLALPSGDVPEGIVGVAVLADAADAGLGGVDAGKGASL